MIKRNTSIIFRALAIIIVMMSHYATWMYLPAANEALRYRISNWGPFGVDIFFLLSGYGLYISASKTTRPSWLFLIKRLLNVYMPYLVIVFVIMLINGEWKDITISSCLDYFIGADYWYIEVLLIIYVLFFVIWSVFGSDMIRIILVSALILAFSFAFHRIGRSDFWIVSNVSFLVGILAAYFEKVFSVKKYSGQERYNENEDKGKAFGLARKVALIITLVGIMGFVFSRIVYQEIIEGNPLGGFAWKCSMNLFFAVFILGCCYLYEILTHKKNIGIIGKLIGIIGENSLYIYLMHQVLFWAMIFVFDKLGYIIASVIVATLSVLISCAVGVVFSRLICVKVLRKIEDCQLNNIQEG